jgi:drug/metabolite transporter (DMT)-like permease
MLSSLVDYTVLGGYILAFVGGYMCALNAVTQAAYSEYFQKLGDDFAATLMVQVAGRTCSAVIAAILVFFLRDKSEPFVIDWLSSFFIGFVVMIFGASLYAYSLLKSDRPTIHIMYYFVPLMAVIWLWIFGYTTLNSGIVIGGIIIVVCNIYLALANRKPSSGV